MRLIMRRFALLLAVPLLLVGLTSCRKGGLGGGSLPAEITSVRVGIPPGPLVGDEDAGKRTETLFKSGQWTPVLVTISGKGQLDGAELVVETKDSDDAFNEFATRLPALNFTDQPQYQFMTYARPGKIESNITVSLRAHGSSVNAPEKQMLALDPTYFLYVTLGARLPGLRVPGLEEKNSSARRSDVGAIDQFGELPTRWLGYNTVDLAILATSNDEFVGELFNNTERRTALIEWVRRGGRLVIAVGKNQSLLQNREDLKEFLPVDFTGTTNVDEVHVKLASTAYEQLGDRTKKTPLTIAKMQPKPDRSVRTLAVAQTPEERPTIYPLIMQAPYGLGRVTVMAVDPDQPPFTRWPKQGDFWKKLLNGEAGPIYPGPRAEGDFTTNDSAATELIRQMQGSIEQFESVPVISFGWVALFILIYILIVGPLDYLFLKKVVKRLELTWVTFPLVVIIVSAAAYFTAYALKGDDQRVQKVDLIDFDQTSQTACGQTWFSIFSPRVQNYTIGVEPAPQWGLAKEPISPPVVSWMARASGTRQSLFRRSYEYDTTVGGLQHVPIQVWSAKSFQATWHQRLDPANPPLTVDLRMTDKGILTGSVASNLPVELENVVVFHRESVYQLGKLAPGANNRRQVTSKGDFAQWKSQNRGMSPPITVQPNRFGGGYQQPAVSHDPTQNIVREVMFHELLETGGGRTPRNAGFRELDQSWRLHKEDSGATALVYGTVPVKSGQAADVSTDAATVTRLWLGALPGGDPGQRNLSGTLRQETYLRFYVPVRKTSN